jgi:hypothetical protein
MTKRTVPQPVSLDDLLNELQGHSTGTRGSAPAKEIDRAARLLSTSGGATLENALRLFKVGTPNAIELGLLVLPVKSMEMRGDVFDLLIKYADHDNWEIREYAGEMLGEYLRYHFNVYKTTLADLRRCDSENVRRAVVIALKYLGKYRELSLSDEILQLLHLYMDDDSNYVKKNLGPFALGDAMIDYDPKRTLDYVKRWASQPNPNVRWNVASVFSTAAGAKHCETGCEILGELIHDVDKSVRLMALKGFNNLYQRNPAMRRTIRAILLPVMEKANLPRKQFTFLET